MDNKERASQCVTLDEQLTAAIKRASKRPNDPAAWVDVATLAGNIQRRARLLAGLGRGG